MAGKARSNNESFEVFQQKINARLENFLDQNTNENTNNFFLTPQPQTKINQFLQLGKGNVIGGAIGYNASIIPISAGAIDIGLDSGKFSSHVIVQAEIGTEDDLTDINNFVYSYQDLTIQAETGHTITIFDTGNIDLGAGVTSIILASEEQIRLRYDIRSNSWRAFVGSAGGGGTGGTFEGYIVARLDTDQNITGAPAGTTVEFDVINQTSSDITLSSFQFSGFTPGHIYECTAYLAIIGTTNPRAATYKWYDNDKAAYFGNQGYGTESPSVAGTQFVAKGYLVADSTTTSIELQILNVDNAEAIQGQEDVTMPSSFCTIVDVSATGGGAGGDVTFPIDFPELDEGDVSGIVGIDFTQDTRHSRKLRLIGNIDLQFNSPPTNLTAYTNIIFLQDGIGGRTVTLPAGTVNKEIVEAGILTDVNAETGIVVKYAFGTFYAFLETGNIVSGGGPGGGLNTDLSNMTAPTIPPVDLNMNQHSILGVTGLDLDGAAATIQGVVNISFFQTPHSINSLPGQLAIQGSALDKISLIIGGTEVAKFDEPAAGIVRFDMLGHTIDVIKDIQLDPFATYSFPGGTPGMGFDSANSRLRFQVPAGDQYTFEENNAGIATGVRLSPAGNGTVNAANINAEDLLQLGVDITVPSVPGEFRNDGTDVLVFSGGAVRNLSALGVQDKIEEGDSSVEVVDPGSGVIRFTADGFLIAQMQNNRMDFSDTDIFGVTHIHFFNATTARTVLEQNPTTFNIDFINTTDVFNIEFATDIAFSVDELRTRVYSTQPNTATSVLSLFRDDPTPALDDITGRIDFDGRNSVGDFTTYAEIEMRILDPADTNETGQLIFNTIEDGITVPTLRIGDGSMTLKEFGIASEQVFFRLQKEDPSPSTNEPIGTINFTILDVSNFDYAQIRGEIKDATDAGRLYLGVRADNSSTISDGLIMEGDDNVADRSYLTVDSYINSDLGFGFDGAGSLQAKIRPKSASTQIGIVVQDNTDFTMGSEGMLAGPAIDNTPPLSDAGMDADFGDHVGAMGLYQTTASTVLFVMKAPDGHWYGDSWLRQTTS